MLIINLIKFTIVKIFHIFDIFFIFVKRLSILYFVTNWKWPYREFLNEFFWVDSVLEPLIFDTFEAFLR